MSMEQILEAMPSDIIELYQLQLLSFESKAKMIVSRLVPALMESEEKFKTDHRQQGLAQKLLSFVDAQCGTKSRQLYTCTKSWINIKLYTKMAYKPIKEVQDETGLSFVYMEKRS